MTTEKEKRIPLSQCPHTDLLEQSTRSDSEACEICGGTDHLRLCLACGFVGCCESEGAHDHAHYEETGHPIITPHRADYDFLWCYECGAYLI